MPDELLLLLEKVEKTSQPTNALVYACSLLCQVRLLLTGNEA